MSKSRPQESKDELKAAIKRLHEKGSGDYESLLNQVKKKVQKIELNLPQMVSAHVSQKIKILEWGRGTGKTTDLGRDFVELARSMPRSTGLLIGPTYQFILTRIVPSLIQGLEMFGMYEGLHFFIGQQPPRAWRNSWGKAYQPPKKYDKYITFWNGMGVHLISHDVPGDGRGLNTDWIRGDEAALLSNEKLQENTDPTLRGTNNYAFEKCKLYGSKVYTSSTPISPEGQWFVNMEEKARENPGKIAFISATCEHNKHNLREGYLEEAKAASYAEWIYDAEYRNIRPNWNKNSFYSLLNRSIHTYSDFDYNYYQKVGQSESCAGDGDLVPGVPLILGMDFGSAINCLTISQYLKSINEHRVLKSMFVLGAEQKIQSDLIDNFCDYYDSHTTKECELWYDNTGNIETGHTRRTRAQQVADQLRQRGWRVSLMTRGNTNPLHDLKHMLWEAILKEDRSSLPRFRINYYNARFLYLSMRNAKAVPGSRGQIKKDKSSERSTKIPRQEATDLSDAMDSVVFGRYYQKLRGGSTILPDTRTMQG